MQDRDSQPQPSPEMAFQNAENKENVNQEQVTTNFAPGGSGTTSSQDQAANQPGQQAKAEEDIFANLKAGLDADEEAKRQSLVSVQTERAEMDTVVHKEAEPDGGSAA